MNIWAIAGIAVSDITPKVEELDFETIKIRHPIWRKKTIEEYRKFTADWQEDIWKISVEDAAYFLDKEEAVQAATENMADLNEGGVYQYACVYPLAVGAYMPRSELSERDIMLYIFTMDEDGGRYRPLIEDGKIARVISSSTDTGNADQIQYVEMDGKDKLFIKRIRNVVSGCVGGGDAIVW